MQISFVCLVLRLWVLHWEAKVSVCGVVVPVVVAVVVLGVGGGGGGGILGVFAAFFTLYGSSLMSRSVFDLG